MNSCTEKKCKKDRKWWWEWDLENCGKTNACKWHQSKINLRYCVYMHRTMRHCIKSKHENNCKIKLYRYTELLKFSGEKMKCYNGRKRNWNGWQAEDFGCFRASSLLKMSVKIWLTSGKEILPSPPASMFANLRDASEEWLGSAAVKDLPKKCWVQYALCNLLCAALIRLTELQDLLYILLWRLFMLFYL